MPCITLHTRAPPTSCDAHVPLLTIENLDFLYTGMPCRSISCTVPLNGACSVTITGHDSIRAARVMYTEAAMSDDMEMMRVRNVSWMSQRKKAEVAGVGVARRDVDVDDMVREKRRVADVPMMRCMRSVGVVMVRSARIDIRWGKGLCNPHTRHEHA